MHKIYTALKSERERLGFTQGQFASLCGVSLRSQANYESGARAPDSDYLTAALQAGCDLEYIFNGVRSRQLDVSALQDCIEILESALVQTGRQLTPAQKARVVGVLYDEYTDEATEFNVQSVVKHLRLVG